KYFVFVLCVYLSHGAIEADVPAASEKLSDAEIAEYLRKHQNLFEVSSTPVPGFKYKLMDLKYVSEEKNPVVDDKDDNGDDIPESFDARRSVVQLLYTFSHHGPSQLRCQGGWPIRAWQYFAYEGVVTGGNYATKGSCRPYEIHPCGHHGTEPYYGECDDEAETPRCKRKCLRDYKKSYPSDKRYGKTAYRLPNSVKAIQRDIMKNGPVVAAFIVYEDFGWYRSGIYKHTWGAKSGGHAVKVIGWGTEKGTPYWLVANSWHDDWGEKGYFRMIRGINDCGFEEAMVAGLIE
ncbi:papain family cysteine protease, partial [Ostertagia ostertagi]